MKMAPLYPTAQDLKSLEEEPRRPIAEALCSARAEGVALAAFNAPSLEVMQAVAWASNDRGRPAIVQISQGTLHEVDIGLIKRLFDSVQQTSGAELYLHLDHCADKELISQCIKAGWDMVMYDGSDLAFAENLKKTAEVVTMAHSAGVAVEAELGAVGGAEDGAAGGAAIADIDEVRNFYRQSGADCLAVGFGNVHGPYKNTNCLQWDVLQQAGEACDLPLVLHGGTGLSDEEFSRAIGFGCAKVNISTALKDVYSGILGDAEITRSAGRNPRVFHEALYAGCRVVCSRYIGMFASVV